MIASGTKIALLAGFGGVLSLMGLAGIDSLSAVHSVEASNQQITEAYLARRRALDQIRSALYFSETSARDSLLSPDIAVPAYADSLHAAQESSADAFRRYPTLPDEKQLLSELRAAVDQYWGMFAPIFNREAPRRRVRSAVVSQVLARRTAILAIVQKIEKMNEHALRAGDRSAADLFQRFRTRLIAMLILTLGIGLLLAGASIFHILRLERQARAGYLEAVAAQAELKKLSARLVQAQEQERRAISRELHDEVGQSLGALLVDLSNLAAMIPEENQAAHNLLAAIRRLAEQNLKALRQIALLLRPSMLDDLGLLPALEWQAREMSRRSGVRVEVVADKVEDDLPEEHRTCVYRVVQEALHNCLRHAAARHVQVAVLHGVRRLLLHVQDDGKGFNTRLMRGLGLLGMEERVKHLGGSFQIRSEPGRGTEIQVELPLPDPAAEARQSSV